ncbi:MAG: PolC-type DNA polymerase III [Mycoplasma sp.]
MNKLVKIITFLKLIPQEEMYHLNNIKVLDFKQIDNKYTFSIFLEKALEPNIFSRIKNMTLDEVSIKLSVISVKDLLIEDIYKYLYYVYEQNSELKYFKHVLDTERVTFDGITNILLFKYRSEAEKNEINLVVKQIIKTIKEAFGLPLIEFEMIFDDEIQKIQQAKEELIKQNIQKAIESHKNKEIPKETVVKETKIDASKIIPLNNVLEGMYNINVTGEIFDIEKVDNAKLTIYKVMINDYESTLLLTYRYFKESTISSNIKKIKETVFTDLKVGDWVCATVDIKNDKYDIEACGYIKKITTTHKPSKYIRKDDASEKRIELTNHSKMSSFDGVSEISDMMKFCKETHTHTLALTDRFNVQSFPEFQKATDKNKIKPIYGFEACISPVAKCAININEDLNLRDMTYIVFDLETTGLYPNYDDIIEFGAVKYKNGQKISSEQFFAKPDKPISEFITSLTNISNDDVKDAMDQRACIMKIMEYIGDSVIIAHNALNFDYNFINAKCERYLSQAVNNVVIDTLHIARGLYPQWKSHKLGKLCHNLGVNYAVDSAHRADYDAEVLNGCWLKLISIFEEQNILTLNDLNIKIRSPRLNATFQNDFNFIYARNSEGLKTINKLVSAAHTETFFGVPKVDEIFMESNRENLIIAPHPVEGEIFRLALYGTTEQLKSAILKYDYIFVCPCSNYLHLTHNNDISESDLIDAIKKMIKYSLSCHKKIVAVSNAYYINPWDKKYQNVYLHAKAINNRSHRYYRYKMLPDQHIRTTSEMIKEFRFLQDDNLIKEIVVTNSIDFAKEISDDIRPIKDGLFAPKMDNVDTLLKDEVYKNAKLRYGDNIPTFVTDRIEFELNSIITHNFAVVYWISHLLVKKSYNDGYPVGSRGSVGSSIIATMLKITDVNPLLPHYICDKCKLCKIEKDADDGFDLIPIPCTDCDGTMYGEGHNIPFETFLGFKGDKTPDIDLNFSGEYQWIAHNFIKEIFGKDHAFRAGTISTIAEKTCYSIVKSYFDEINNFDSRISDISLYVKKCQNVKRTTGQHPGGILVVPSEYSIYDFTPYNFPADDLKSEWFTTHYAFEYLHDNLLKFDILGHDNPTILKRLKDLTGIDESQVPNYDPAVMKMFNDISPLKLAEESYLPEKTGAISIPEFGTKFVREMLVDTKPQTFSDLIRISGLSHGTNVYLGNAKDLIKKQNLKLKDVIACRDDIMIYLINQGIEHSTAFGIMEDVRKGKKLRPEQIEVMQANKIPNWYIESCDKIEYIFPKAHATAYVMHAWKFAWYKLYYPLQYYSTFFSVKADVFDIPTIAMGKLAIKTQMDKIRALLANRETANQVKKKEQDLLVIYEVCLEMIGRGYNLLKPDIYLSDSANFVVHNNTIIAPFSCIEGIGVDAAKTIIEAREERRFTSLDDFANRTKINKTSIAKLKELGVFDTLPASDQISLFEI